MTDFSTVPIPLASTVIYIFGLAIFWILAFFLLYHLIRFGIGTTPKRLAFIFLLGSATISLVITLLFVSLNITHLTSPLFNF